MRVAFYRAWPDGKLLDKSISILTLGPFSHCELVFSNGVCFSSSYRDGGVRFKQIQFVPSRWSFIDIPGVDEDKIWQWCETIDHKKYDIMGAIALVPRIRQIQNKNKWYCSELCATALKNQGAYHGRTFITPSGLYGKLCSSRF